MIFNNLGFIMKNILGLLFFLLFILPLQCFADITSAKIVSVRPQAFVLQENRKENARVASLITQGETLETGISGRISLLLPDHMLLKIASETSFIYDPSADKKNSGTLKKGKIWLRGHRKGQDFSIRTPSATTAIRGTEWYIEVDENETTTIGVMDGIVEVANEFGKVVLQSRELATVKKGYPPVKNSYIVPENAVNWTLNYHGFWDEKDFQKAGTSLRASIQQALQAYESNNFDKTLEIVSATEKQYGKTASWLALKGFIELISGNDGKAEYYFNEASETAPDWALPLAHIALMKLVENKLEEAEAFVTKAAKIEPDSSVAMIVMAYVEKANLELEKAYEYAQKAINLSPGFDHALIVAARIALEMDDTIECEKILKQISPDSVVLAEKKTLSGFLELRNGKSLKALKKFEAAVTLNPEASDAMMGKGIALFNTNSRQEGLEAIIHATLISPQISSLQSYLAKAYLENNDYTQADQSLDRAKRLDPKDPTPYLYESLNFFEKHEPGKAINSLSKAQALNKNRAVFRSKYLIDQDNAVLMSNVSSLYNELGFNYSSMLSASMAIEEDPLNAAAYRRLFFSDAFGTHTRPIYQQSMETEKLLAKMFVPPTLNSIIFTPAGLSPYQQMFVNSGINTLSSGNYVNRNTKNSNLDTLSGYFSLAGKPDSPFAMAIAFMPSRQTSDTDFLSENHLTTSESDLDNLNALTTAKWQISPAVEIFAELSINAMTMDTKSLSNSENSSVTDLGIYGSYFTDTVSQTISKSSTDSENYTFDMGIHYEFNNELHTLFHFGYGKDSSDVNSRTDTNNTTTFGGTGLTPQISEYSNSSVSTTETDDSYEIIQGTIWKKMDQHFIEIGFRFFHDKYDTENETITLSSVEKYFYSYFLSHQYKPIDSVILNGGIGGDNSRYKSMAGIDDTNWYTNYNLGATWEVNQNWTFRMAFIKNTVGDDKRRLQRPMTAGFPTLALSSDEYLNSSDENRLHLEHKTLYSGIDFKANGYPLFAGILYSRDRGNTFSYDDIQSFDHLEKEENSHNIQVYFETLLTRNLSFGTSCSYSDIDLDESSNHYKGETKRAQATISYFFPHGLSLKFMGTMEIKDLQITSDTKTFRPELNWYGLDNRIRFNLRGNFESNSTNGLSDRVDGISFNCYWYY